MISRVTMLDGKNSLSRKKKEREKERYSAQDLSCATCSIYSKGERGKKRKREGEKSRIVRPKIYTPNENTTGTTYRRNKNTCTVRLNDASAILRKRNYWRRIFIFLGSSVNKNFPRRDSFDELLDGNIKFNKQEGKSTQTRELMYKNIEAYFMTDLISI